MWLAEIRKFGGCFVGGTQLVSQLNAIYGHETAHTITGLCGTKVVMNVPEPETAKYMSGFLGEKEEISTMESISYGANTVRDGVNIAQQTHKKSSVPFNEIMNLKTGEAFIKFSGIDLVTKTKFKLHDQYQRDGACSTGVLFRRSAITSQIQSAYLSAGSDSISARVADTDEEIVQTAKFLDDARSKNKRVVVFEDGSKLYDACFQEGHDILLNPKKDNGYAWDMLGEFEGNYVRFIETIIELVNMTEEEKKETEIYLAEVLLNIEKFTSTASTADVMNKLIFQPIKEVANVLSNILDANDNLKKYANIRTTLALHLNFLRPEKNCAKEISITDYIGNSRFDGKILFVSCFNDKNAMRIAKLITDCSHDVLRIFSSKTLFMESQNCIIDATPEAKSTTITRRYRNI
jgi:hypothetical protein